MRFWAGQQWLFLDKIWRLSKNLLVPFMVKKLRSLTEAGWVKYRKNFMSRWEKKSQTMEVWKNFRDKNSGFKMGNLKEPEGSNVKNEVSLSQKVKSEVQQQNGENSSNSTNSSGSGKIFYIFQWGLTFLWQLLVKIEWIWIIIYHMSNPQATWVLSVLEICWNKTQDPGYLMTFFGRFLAQYFLGYYKKTRDNLSRFQPGTSRIV